MQICTTNELDRDDVIAIARLTISLLDQLPGNLPVEERAHHIERALEEVLAKEIAP